jgi:hypothetical protein
VVGRSQACCNGDPANHTPAGAPCQALPHISLVCHSPHQALLIAAAPAVSPPPPHTHTASLPLRTAVLHAGRLCWWGWLTGRPTRCVLGATQAHPGWIPMATNPTARHAVNTHPTQPATPTASHWSCIHHGGVQVRCTFPAPSPPGDPASPLHPTPLLIAPQR